MVSSTEADMIRRELAYPSEKAREERRNNPASYYIYRRLSWPIVGLTYRMGVHPVAITCLAFAISLVGLILVAKGFAVFGLVLLNVAYLLDQVDGGLARATGSTSELGSWLDSVTGYLYSTWTLGACGVGSLMTRGVPTIALVGGLVGSAAISTRKQLVSLTETCDTVVNLELAGRGGPARVVKGINSFSLLLLLLAALLQILEVVVVVLSIYQVGVTVGVGITLTGRLR